MSNFTAFFTFLTYADVPNAFWELLGQIGATLVSIMAGGLIVLLLYLKERRDNLRQEILPKKQELEDEVARVRDTRLVGLSTRLTRNRPDEAAVMQNTINFQNWLFPPHLTDYLDSEAPNPRNTHYKNIKELRTEILNDFWNFFIGLFPNQLGPNEWYIDEINGMQATGNYRALPPIDEVGSEHFINWGNSFLRYTFTFDNFYKQIYEHNDEKYSQFDYFIDNMKELEENIPQSFHYSKDMEIFLYDLNKLRQSVKDCIEIERKYIIYKTKNAIRYYSYILFLIISLSVTSCIVPLLTLILNISKYEMILSTICLTLSIIFSYITIYLLIKPTTQ